MSAAPFRLVVTIGEECRGHVGIDITATVTGPASPEAMTARAKAVTILARVATMAAPHLTARARAHRCVLVAPGDWLDTYPPDIEGCHVYPGAGLLDNDFGDPEEAPYVTLYVPSTEARQWAAAVRRWLALVAAQDATLTTATNPPAQVVPILKRRA